MGFAATVAFVGKDDEGVVTYCCGQPKASDNKIVCPDGHPPFRVEQARLVPGHAALANVSSLSKANNSEIHNITALQHSDHHRDVAIGAGVGVPLGVIALTAIAWAIFERRGRLQQAKTSANSSVSHGHSPMHGINGPPPVAITQPPQQAVPAYPSQTTSVQPIYPSSSPNDTINTLQAKSPPPQELNQSITELNGHHIREHELQ